MSYDISCFNFQSFQTSMKCTITWNKKLDLNRFRFSASLISILGAKAQKCFANKPQNVLGLLLFLNSQRHFIDQNICVKFLFLAQTSRAKTTTKEHKKE